MASFALILLLVLGLGDRLDAGSCPVTASTKIPNKCSTCFDLINKQIIGKTTILDKKVMWAVASDIGDTVVNYMKPRIAAGNKGVPTMCEIGELVKDYAVDHLDVLIACAGDYNSPTVAKVAADGAAALLYCTVNGIDLQGIANSLICALLECLTGPYKNQLCPKYKKWTQNLNKTVIQNNFCDLCAQYLQNQKVLQSCFNSAKARTTVKVLQNLYDKYIPNYATKFQTYRDKSLVACQTKSSTCGCNIDVTDAINAGQNAIG